ncbi:two-component system response regulator BaeR/two-component system response regulator AdeR [Oceanithermus desulfurans]|nr:two-component system response regulator BaeR/two-component system response regulator AdeR [Oceanithermus desulfurans]
MAEKRILVVEDEARIADVLERYLRAEGFVTERAASGKRALELWRAFRPDLILLDLMLPEIGGLEVARTIRAQSDVPILMVTAKAEEVDRLVGLELGADDYITKPFSPREVVARVRAVLRRVGGGARAARIYRVGAIAVDLDAFEARCGEAPVALSPTQLRLLAALAQAEGRALSRHELLDQLGEAYVDARTVDAHVKNLRRRLGPCGAQIETVRGVGYRLRGSSS